MEQRAQRQEEKRIETEKKHEERRVRTEQKAAEKKARDEAEAARRAENPEAKSRFFPSFLGKPGVGAATGAGVGAAAVAEGIANTGTALPGISSSEPADLEGDTVHDRVTLDPTQAEHALAAADEDDEELPRTLKANPATTSEAPPEPVEGEEVGPKDDAEPNVLAQETSPPLADAIVAEPTSPQSPTSPSKRDSKVRSFFKKLRGTSKAENEHKPEGVATTKQAEEVPTTATVNDVVEPVKEGDQGTTDSMRDVALAGRSDNETEDMYGGSAKPHGRVSPIQAEEGTGSGPAFDGDKRDVSPPSDIESDEEPYVIAADVASSRYSTEHTGSKRNSGYDQVAALEEEEDEPRGRKGFRERFFKKKDKKPGGFSSAGIGSSSAAAATTTTTSANAAVTVPSQPEPPKETPQEVIRHDDEQNDEVPTKVPEPSTTSTEATHATTMTGTTTPALTHAQTNGDDDDDFEEARDTFDEGRILSASKVESGEARIVDVNSPISPTASATTLKPRASNEGSRFTEEL
jgi:hypothetical protein